MTVDEEFVHDVRPSAGITAVAHLSDYLPALKETPGDSTVYFFDGEEKGGTVLVAGGTHGNEIGGIMAAILLVERARVRKGRLIVIPHANNSAVRCSDPRRLGSSSITLTTPSARRLFIYGSRLTSPEHQGVQDPQRYRHPKSAADLDGSESRNLDRVFPGKAAGSLTEKVAYAIVQLLKQERVDIAFDLHESGPESRLVWTVIAHPNSLGIAARAVLDLDAAGISLKLESSSETSRGMSHREWGDVAHVKAFLFETPNPGMGEMCDYFDLVNDMRFPLARRVGIQLSALMAVLAAYNSTTAPELTVKLLDIPGLLEISEVGVGAFLK